VTRAGHGPPVLLVHGSVVGADRTWRHQLDLAESWRLILPNRPGFGASPPLARGDFEAEAPLVAELLGDGSHLVGHSYGAVIALYAAALRPRAVRSLTVSEPGCLRVAAGDPLVDAQIAGGDALYGAASTLAPLDFLRAFRGGVGSTHETPPELEGELLAGVRLLTRERPPWEADPPFDALAAAGFPKLVISGAHSPVFERVCDIVAERIGAERAVVSGRGHTIPSAGAPYNERLCSLLAAGERRWAGARANAARTAPGSSKLSRSRLTDRGSDEGKPDTDRRPNGAGGPKGVSEMGTPAPQNAARELTIEASVADSRHRLTLAGELDLASAANLVDAVSKHCGEGAESIVIDIGGLEFVDSTGLRAILTSRVVCSRSHCTLAIEPSPERVRPQVRRLLEVTGLVDRLPFAEGPAAG
jgi:anti-anti-sigma factor